MTTPRVQEIEIDLGRQRMTLRDHGKCLAVFDVSTALNGAGEQMDSECTPRGRHVIDEKIGKGCAPGTVFVGRRPTGEIYDARLRARFPDRDWILTRVLWLRGIEPGRNMGGDLDSKARYIYIHGTPDDTDMSVPGSRGCVRMRNTDITHLFEWVEIDTPVNIISSRGQKIT